MAARGDEKSLKTIHDIEMRADMALPFPWMAAQGACEIASWADIGQKPGSMAARGDENHLILADYAQMLQQNFQPHQNQHDASEKFRLCLVSHTEYIADFHTDCR